MCRLLIFHANQTGMYIFEPVFINVNKPSMLQSYLQKKFQGPYSQKVLDLARSLA